MAIQIENPHHRDRLSKALKKSFTDSQPRRRFRANLVDIYKDEDNHAYHYLTDDREDLGTLINLFQKYVRGHLLSVAHNSPRWAVDARTTAGRGLDKRLQAFLTRYSEILNFNRVQKQLALDSAFGWAVAKVDSGLAPKGITAPVAPRVYRINPDMLIVDQAAPTIDECAFIGDMYLVPLNEAQAHPGFNEEGRSKLTEYHRSSSTSRDPNSDVTDDSYAEPMVRLLDVYIPKKGTIYTWPAPNDDFSHVATTEPLGARQTPVNPYCLLSLLAIPGILDEISRLGSLRGLHLLANEMLHKGVQQARASQRNPTAPMGSMEDLETALVAGDNNPISVEDQKNLGLFTIPGPDAAILNLGNYAVNEFGKHAGNLDVALGSSAGADTARQTEALIGQISASQALDRSQFEEFLSSIGEKLATLAFHSEVLELETRVPVPGTRFEFSQLWTTPQFLPRVANIDTFHFNVVSYSTSFRNPQERLSQLSTASDLVMKWMIAKGQGAPINLEAIMNTASESFDLIPELLEWWDGEEPTPAERTENTYQSLAASPQGSDVRHHGSQNGEGGPAFQNSEVQGGPSS